jgi:hypothetical protein
VLYISAARVPHSILLLPPLHRSLFVLSKSQHQKHQLEGKKASDAEKGSPDTYQPFSNLKDLLNEKV